MAYSTTQHQTRVFANLRSAFESIREAVMRHIQYTESLRALENLNQRQLDDIGVIKADLPNIVRRDIYGA